jgi:phytoene desaturase
MKIGIIGAGIAGVAIAARLAARGHTVEVFETNDYPGGKLSEFKQDGYRFDAGPSLFTMPMFVDAVFEDSGEAAIAHFQYERLPIVCRYHWEDGTYLNAWAEAPDFAAEIERVLDVPRQKVLDFLTKSRSKYLVSGQIFLEKSLHKLSTWLNLRVVKALFQIPSMDIFMSMNAVHERDLGHPKLVQLFNRFATYNGSDPYKAPGILTIIPHFEHGIGAFYPKGGMFSITHSLYKLAQRKGAVFHFKQPVQEILVEKNKIVGLISKGEHHLFDVVVSNMDVYYTYKKLLPHEKHPERTLQQERSSSALIYYWGIRSNFPTLQLHNIFFSQDYKQEFDKMAAGEVSDDPTVYVNITSKYNPNDAPNGHEAWFVMINVPADQGQDWDEIIARSRSNVIRKLSKALGLDIQSLIATEAILDPRSIEAKTASFQGALYGTSSNSQMAAFLRHPNFTNRLKHLYFVGGSVHPGGGIPLCLLSAKIVDELISKRTF